MGMAKRPRGWRRAGTVSPSRRYLGRTQAIVARPPRTASRTDCLFGKEDCTASERADEMNQLVYLFSLTFLSNEQANERREGGQSCTSIRGGGSIALLCARPLLAK